MAEVFENLDYREKNGYQRHDADLEFDSGARARGLVYIAAVNNFAYLGDDTLDNIATQIAYSEGPSGTNRDYLFELAAALRALDLADPHIIDLEAAVRRKIR